MECIAAAGSHVIASAVRVLPDVGGEGGRQGSVCVCVDQAPRPRGYAKACPLCMDEALVGRPCASSMASALCPLFTGEPPVGKILESRAGRVG